jgi:uncharacterized membrane protein
MEGAVSMAGEASTAAEGFMVAVAAVSTAAEKPDTRPILLKRGSRCVRS